MFQGVMACWGKVGQSNGGIQVIKGCVLPTTWTCKLVQGMTLWISESDNYIGTYLHFQATIGSVPKVLRQVGAGWELKMHRNNAVKWSLMSQIHLKNLFYQKTIDLHLK